eukprot:SAG31_NODE_1428_length_8391_cov_4.335866_4_plen_87_part_00
MSSCRHKCVVSWIEQLKTQRAFATTDVSAEAGCVSCELADIAESRLAVVLRRELAGLVKRLCGALLGPSFAATLEERKLKLDGRLR